MLSFPDYLRQRVGANWVLARRTPAILHRYGDDVACLSQARYSQYELAYERETGLAAHGAPGEPSRFVLAAAPAMLAALVDLCGSYADTRLPEWRAALAAILTAKGETP